MKGKKTAALWVSIVLVTGFAATSLASYFVAVSSMRSQITKNELPLTGDNIYSEIQRDLLRPIFISSLMASDTFLRDWMLHGEKDEQQVTRYLRQIQEKYGTVTSFLVSDRTRIYYHPDGILKTVRKTEPRDDWYFRVRKMTSDYEINIDPDMANKDSMTIFINYKVYDYQGRYIGATGVGLTVHSVREVIREYQENFGRSIYFTDKGGAIQLHSSGSGEKKDHIRQIQGLSEIADTVLEKDHGDFRYQCHGTTIYLNTRYIPEFDMYLFVEQREDTAVRPLLHALFVNLGICTIITVLVLTLVQVTIARYQGQLEEMATTDKLTGIYNRQAFDIVMDQAIRETRRTQEDLSLILFDLDHFKKINDQFGHLAGDAVIRHLSHVTQGFIRESDMFCRWGGEEFLIILKNCHAEAGYHVAEKIRRAVEEKPAVYGAQTIPFTISCGVAQYRTGESKDHLLTRADLCMYQAKAGGRNQSVKEQSE